MRRLFLTFIAAVTSLASMGMQQCNSVSETRPETDVCDEEHLSVTDCTMPRREREESAEMHERVQRKSSAISVNSDNQLKFALVIYNLGQIPT